MERLDSAGTVSTDGWWLPAELSESESPGGIARAGICVLDLGCGPMAPVLVGGLVISAVEFCSPGGWPRMSVGAIAAR